MDVPDIFPEHAYGLRLRRADEEMRMASSRDSHIHARKHVQGRLAVPLQRINHERLPIILLRPVAR